MNARPLDAALTQTDAETLARNEELDVVARPDVPDESREEALEDVERRDEADRAEESGR